MFTFESRILTDERMLVCLTENLTDDFCIITTFADNTYYDGKEVALATFDNPELDISDEELKNIIKDPVDAYEYPGFMHRLAYEYIYILVTNALSEIVDGQDWSGSNIKEIFETRDTAWDPIREVWEHAASDVKAKLLTMLER